MGDVFLGMSGGVDSAVCAALLIKQGFRVHGVTFLLCGENESRDITDARLVCRKLGIDHTVLDLRNEFKAFVTEPFFEAYRLGRTPNPCVLCNKSIKFGFLMKKADEMSGGMIATGHYARIKENENGRFSLIRGDAKKDQSYFLYGLTQKELSRTIFPLAELTKDMVRKLAASLDLPVKSKSDSQDICFVPGGNFAETIREKLGETRGDFLSPGGEKLGEHSGIWNYTVGQRRGFGVSFGKPMYVSAIIPEKNAVVLSDCKEDIFSAVCRVTDVNLIKYDALTAPLRAEVKIRYAHRAAPAALYPDQNGIRIEFDTPQRAITPGQSAVFYDGDEVIGGGIIR